MLTFVEQKERDGLRMGEAAGDESWRFDHSGMGATGAAESIAGCGPI